MVSFRRGMQATPIATGALWPPLEVQILPPPVVGECTGSTVKAVTALGHNPWTERQEMDDGCWAKGGEHERGRITRLGLLR